MQLLDLSFANKICGGLASFVQFPDGSYCVTINNNDELELYGFLFTSAGCFKDDALVNAHENYSGFQIETIQFESHLHFNLLPSSGV